MVDVRQVEVLSSDSFRSKNAFVDINNSITFGLELRYFDLILKTPLLIFSSDFNSIGDWNEGDVSDSSNY